VRNWLNGLWGNAVAKGRWHWFIVLAITAVGTGLGHWLHEAHVWPGLRYAIYRPFSWIANRGREVNPSRTIVVAITDDDYWKGELGRRSPIKRRYLAKLVRALDHADPQVIALDFQLRSPTVDGIPAVEHPDYQAETADFLAAVREVSTRRAIVLPASIGSGYVVESSIYRGYDFGKGRIFKGYIELPYEIPTIPVAIPVKSQQDKLDSFSEAIVRATKDRAISELEGVTDDRLPFGTYFNYHSFEHVLASDILDGKPAAREAVSHQIALVGGVWHQFAYNRGPLADGHSSPMGEVPGVYIHANYVEDVLNHRVYPVIWPGVGVAIEVIFVLALSLVLAAPESGWKKAGVVGATCVGLLAVAYFFFQNFGLFFDFFIPLILVAGHAGFEEIRDWKEKAAKWDSAQAKTGTQQNSRS